MLVVAELNGSGNQISEGSVTDVLNKHTIIHTDINITRLRALMLRRLKVKLRIVKIKTRLSISMVSH